MKVSDILAQKGHDIIHIKPNDTVYDAIALMSEKNIGGLLVIENDELKGIITERDYRNKVILKGRASKTTAVSEIMTSNVNYVKPEQNVYDCMALMTEKRFRHCPVIDNGKLVGVISMGDLVNALIQEQKTEIKELRNYITGGYPG